MDFDEDITPLFEHLPTAIVKDRFFVKISSMNISETRVQYLAVVFDVLSNNFAMKRYDSREQLSYFIKSLSLL